MKKILTIIFYTVVFNSYSQHITLDQLFALRNKNIVEVEDFLSKRNWQLISAEEPANDRFGNVTFAYKKSSYSDNAEAFITYYYSKYQGGTSRILMEFFDLPLYNKNMLRLNELGYSLTSSSVKNGTIEKTYSGKLLTIMTAISPRKESAYPNLSQTNTRYSFFILTTKTYEYHRKEEEAVKTIEKAAAAARKGYDN